MEGTAKTVPLSGVQAGFGSIRHAVSAFGMTNALCDEAPHRSCPIQASPLTTRLLGVVATNWINDAQVPKSMEAVSGLLNRRIDALLDPSHRFPSGSSATELGWLGIPGRAQPVRSEERRVGKEC